MERKRIRLNLRKSTNDHLNAVAQYVRNLNKSELADAILRGWLMDKVKVEIGDAVVRLEERPSVEIGENAKIVDVDLEGGERL